MTDAVTPAPGRRTRATRTTRVLALTAALVGLGWLALLGAPAQAAAPLATGPAYAASSTTAYAAGPLTAGELTTPGAQPSAEAGTQGGTQGGAATGQESAGTQGPTGPTGPAGADDSSVTVELDGLTDKPSSSITLLITLTLFSLLPAIVLTCTSFTKILVVLGLTRNALGLQQTPPNQVLAGLALFLSLFIMAPVLSDINEMGVQPYLDGDKTTTQAYSDGVVPLREFMLKQTGDDELMLLTNVARRDLPDNRDDVAMSTLVPAFVLSELKEAFIIGFIVFIPFLVIDIVVSGALMALGMMMMPPVMVSLPFKLLLFVLVDGWALVIKSLVASYG